MDNFELNNDLSTEEPLLGLDLNIDAEEPLQQDPTNDLEEPKEKESGWKAVLQSVHDLVYLGAILIILTLLFRVVVVSGTSMTNTLQNGDYLLVLSNVFYQEPKQGDIIVASKQSFDNGAPIIKRVIATEGQWVDIDFQAGIVYVGDSQDNMQPLTEPYVKTPTNYQEGMKFPLQVEEGCIFVLGDNRNGSKDSRDPVIGLIDKREVLGKAFFLFIPGESEGTKNRDFGRIGVVD